MIPSEDGIIVSEGGIIVSKGDIIASEGDNIDSEGVLTLARSGGGVDATPPHEFF